ncbi:MAG: hypothetical protein ACRDHE_10625 [Ktedonobacterales bacterium]
MQQVPPLIETLTLEVIQSLALPSNLRYGTAIYERGAVKCIASTPTSVEAWVGGLDGTVAEGGGSRRRTRITCTPDGLTWRCSGNPKHHQIFCKHCVALALMVVHPQE